MVDIVRMQVDAGWSRETQVMCDVTILDGVAGEINCLECGGSGTWGFMEPEESASPCVQCKGTGRQLVSI